MTSKNTHWLDPVKSRARRARWRKAHPEQQRLIELNYNRSVPLKIRQARKAVFDAVRKGILIKGVCWCGSKKKIEAHHHNGYDNALDVVWLCQTHHLEIHRQLREQNKQ